MRHHKIFSATAMNLSKIFSILLATFLVFGGAAAAQSGGEQAVRKLERAWLDAYEQRDQKAMNEIVADDFLITFPDGSTQTKSQILESLKKPNGIQKTTVKFSTEDVRARVYGDTVILTGRVISELWRDGTSVSKEESRYTDTYVHRNNNWQVVASHLSNSPPTPKQ